jgi:chromosome segregation ATPase
MLHSSRSVLALAALSTLAATPALAAPADSRLEAMQRELEAMRAELAQMKAEAGRDARIEAMQRQLDGLFSQLAEIRSAQTAASAHLGDRQPCQRPTHPDQRGREVQRRVPVVYPARRRALLPG